MAAPTINKVEIAEMSLNSLLKADLSTADRAVLAEALKVVHGLRPNVNAADHMPVYTTAQNGDKRVVGCSCGETPKKAAAAMSQTMSFFNRHLATVGVPRNYGRDANSNQIPRFTDGARAGMTFSEAMDAALL